MKEGDFCWLNDEMVQVDMTRDERAAVTRISDGAKFTYLHHSRFTTLPSWLRPIIKVKLLRPTATMPKYATAGAAAADVYVDFGGFDGPVDVASVALITEGDMASGSWVDGKCNFLRFERGCTVSLPLGIAMEIPPGFFGILKDRSGAYVRGRDGHVDYIDSDYRGEVCMLMRTGTTNALTINHGDRVGQIAFVPVAHATFVESAELSETARGTGGFGSTGTR